MSTAADPLGNMVKAVTRALDPITLDYLEQTDGDRVAALVMLVPTRDLEPLREELRKLARGAVSREDVVRHALDVLDTSRDVSPTSHSVG